MTNVSKKGNGVDKVAELEQQLQAAKNMISGFEATLGGLGEKASKKDAPCQYTGTEVSVEVGDRVRLQWFEPAKSRSGRNSRHGQFMSTEGEISSFTRGAGLRLKGSDKHYPLSAVVPKNVCSETGVRLLDPKHDLYAECARSGCGHAYERHFDLMDGNGNQEIGCKYCSCASFVEPPALPAEEEVSSLENEAVSDTEAAKKGFNLFVVNLEDLTFNQLTRSGERSRGEYRKEEQCWVWGRVKGSGAPPHLEKSHAGWKKLGCIDAVHYREGDYTLFKRAAPTDQRREKEDKAKQIFDAIRPFDSAEMLPRVVTFLDLLYVNPEYRGLETILFDKILDHYICESAEDSRPCCVVFRTHSGAFEEGGYVPTDLKKMGKPLSSDPNLHIVWLGEAAGANNVWRKVPKKADRIANREALAKQYDQSELRIEVGRPMITNPSESEGSYHIQKQTFTLWGVPENGAAPRFMGSVDTTVFCDGPAKSAFHPYDPIPPTEVHWNKTEEVARQTYKTVTSGTPLINFSRMLLIDLPRMSLDMSKPAQNLGTYLFNEAIAYCLVAHNPWGLLAGTTSGIIGDGQAALLKSCWNFKPFSDNPDVQVVWGKRIQDRWDERTRAEGAEEEVEGRGHDQDD